MQSAVEGVPSQVACRVVAGVEAGALRVLPLEGVCRARSSGQGKSCSPSQGISNALGNCDHCVYFVCCEYFDPLLYLILYCYDDPRTTSAN